ncbi:MAG: hypothetical protein AAF721_32040 [Myxococcota bacterium]
MLSPARCPSLPAWICGLLGVACGAPVARSLPAHAPPPAGESVPCTLEDQLRVLAAPDAVDCGHATVDRGVAAVRACVRRSLARGTPFVAAFDMTGIDSLVGVGAVSDARGAVHSVHFDSNICGVGSGEECGPRVTAVVCHGARLASRKRGLLRCEQRHTAPMCEPGSGDAP